MKLFYKFTAVFSLVLLMIFNSAVVGNAVAMQQKKTAGKAPARKPAAKPPVKPDTTKPSETEATEPPSGDALERIRALPTAQERINALEKLITTQRGTELEPKARDLLMREYATRGEQHLREGNPQLAAKDFKAVLRVAPDPITDKIFDQFIFPMPIAMGTFGYRVEAVELMQSFERRFEGDVNRLVQIGFFYVQIEAPIEAVRILEQAVKLAPQDHRAHNGLGNAYLISLRLTDALAEYEKAVEINANDEFANLNIANLARATGDYPRAAEFYRKHLKLKSDDASALAGLAITLYAQGQDNQAARSFQEALQLEPQNYAILLQQAFFFLSRKKPDLARPLIEQAARIAPRYAWAFIAKANADAQQLKYGDALAAMIKAQELGEFATLNFELIKALMNVDGYSQAIEVMKKTFTVTPEGEFETMLGGVSKARSQRLDLLIERERQAALFLNEFPTTSLQYRLAEALGRIDKFIEIAAAAKNPPATKKPTGGKSATAKANKGEENLSGATRPRRTREEAPATNAPLSAGNDAGLAGMDELLKAITTFTTLDDGRQAFRMVWVAHRLTEANLALDAVEQLSRRAIAMAEAATEPDNSMRDAPLLDRAGRRAVFLGRAYDALGWALFKKGDKRAAIGALTKSVENYLPSPERKTALWHLAVATEEAGDDKNALEFYIASYDASASTATVRRAQIETLYKKVNGSLTGLDERLRQQ